MKIYLVGGAVRDQLLGRPHVERDFVVVGATPDDLLALGYRPVGKDFPVFLHPATGEQYALARTERKTGPGYYGFATRFAPGRHARGGPRPARPDDQCDGAGGRGRARRPYGGQRDLEARVLRHVSPAFVEDPLRVLRVARFAARFAPLGFTVAPETLDLMRGIVTRGEMAALVPERVWVETERALGEDRPTVYFEVLRELRRARGGVPGDRRARRRAAAGKVASGDRHRRAHDAGARGRHRAVARHDRALRRTGARRRQGPHASGGRGRATSVTRRPGRD